MSKIHRSGDEYELLPTGCEDHVRFRQYRGGRCIAGGVANRGSGAMEPGSEVLDLSPPDADGRRQCKGHFTINAQGSVCHSGVVTPAYRDGWDRIFAERRAPSRAN
mgnify:FL=1